MNIAATTVIMPLRKFQRRRCSFRYGCFSFIAISLYVRKILKAGILYMRCRRFAALKCKIYDRAYITNKRTKCKHNAFSKRMMLRCRL